MMFELTARELIAEIFLAGGAFFLHASGNSETLGIMLSFIGLMIYEGMTIVSVKLLLISLLIVLGNPIGTHILSKAAYKSGHHVWTLEEDAKEDKEDADLHH